MIASRDLWLCRITDTLAARRIVLTPPNVLTILAHMLISLEKELGVFLEDDIAAGLLLHLLFSCQSQQPPAMRVKREARQYLKHLFPGELALCQRAISEVSQQCHFPLPKDEAYNLLGILRKIDIFIEINHAFHHMRPQDVWEERVDAAPCEANRQTNSYML